ncbi:MAG TPA: transferrin receptor-like dimerization domain-containing protein [Vicinamibacterales bacterium]|nr:transferrin receptor-like dimerization domain-containing protein [Vicinamibacterales bacterium]
MSRRFIALVVIFLAFAPPGETQTPVPIRGFSAKSSEAERQAEDRFRAIPKPDNNREYMRVITAQPHHAGSSASRKVAEYIQSQFKSWGLNASIESFEALMPYPTERLVEMVAPEPYRLNLKEPPVAQDTDSTDPGGLPTFNAYSADGDVTADLVYVNFGTPEDYEQLAKLGVDVKGKIAIARYGRSWRGIKPKVAYEHGAVGCIIYSDPHEDGYFPGDVYPEGAYRPEMGVQRGSVMDMPIHPGDPLTPGTAAEPGVARMDRSASPVILKIPVLPISYGDALPLLRSLKGPVAPEAWRGSLPITYHVGAGPAKVHMKLAFDWQIRPLHDVIVRIPGSEFPDEWIVHGNHHDAWVNGAADPTSGQVALMETARGLGELLKTGWRPKRTIVLAAWDGEEWGLLGSTEWVEKHAQELSTKAVAYINSDSTSTGWLNVSGSHSLQAFVNDVMRDLQDPKRPGKTLFQAKLDRAISLAKTDAEKTAIQKRRDFPIEALGSGSDYTAFLDYLTIASLSMDFGGEAPDAGVYHSTYDSFYWYTHFSDTDYAFGAALSRTIGTAILRLADADVLPFEFTATASTLDRYVDEIESLRKETKGAPALDLTPLKTAIGKLQKAAGAYDRALSTWTKKETALDRARQAELNRLLYTSERAFKYDAGLPKREWFKHLAYAPGFYTGYGVKTLPGIREGIEQKAWDEPRKYIPIVAAAIDKLASNVERAASLLR